MNIVLVGAALAAGSVMSGCGESVRPFGLQLEPDEITLAQGTQNQAGDVTRTSTDVDIIIACMDNRGEFFVELTAAGVPGDVQVEFIPSGIPGISGGLVDCSGGGSSEPAPTTISVGLATPGEYQITIAATTFEDQEAIISAEPLMTESAVLTLIVTP